MSEMWNVRPRTRSFAHIDLLAVFLSKKCFRKPYWLAVHGKPVLFWKGISGLKFPCFLFYAYLIARMEMGTSRVSGDSDIIT